MIFNPWRNHIMKRLALIVAALAIIAAACGEHRDNRQDLSMTVWYDGFPFTCELEHNHYIDPVPGTNIHQGVARAWVVRNDYISGAGAAACTYITVCIQYLNTAGNGAESCATGSKDMNPGSNVAVGGVSADADGVGESRVRVSGPPAAGTPMMGWCEYHDPDNSNFTAPNCPAGLPIP